jgi:hypothetical protein
MAKSIAVKVVLGASAALDKPNINLLLTYKVQRVGNTITYLVNDVVFYTSAITSTVPLYMDTAFFSAGGKIDEEQNLQQ